MATQVDLWGDIGPAEPVRTPVTILREQAALLGRKTKNVLEAKVSSFTLAGGLTHSFNIVVPGLDDYTYELFQIQIGVDAYPVFVSVPPTMATVKLETEQQFTEWLKAKLSSPETKKIIGNLLAQATT